MHELINRTNGFAEEVFASALDAAYLACFLGLSYLAMSLLTTFLTRLKPARVRDRHLSLL